jgi:hypothetical protein
VVSAAHRDVDRGLDRVHGARKYRRSGQRPAALDDRVRVRAGSRLWVFVRAARDAQFAGSHLAASLLAFNAGVELGQILVLVLLVPLLQALFRFVVAERMGTILLSAFVAHTGWHWMVDRADDLRQYPLEWPALSAAMLASGMRWLMLALLLAGLLWGLSRLLSRNGALALSLPRRDASRRTDP